jgi:hypothetical protein
VTFPIFLVLWFVVLRLTFRWRWRTVLIAAVVLALVGDFAVDMLVAVGNGS